MSQNNDKNLITEMNAIYDKKLSNAGTNEKIYYEKPKQITGNLAILKKLNACIPEKGDYVKKRDKWWKKENKKRSQSVGRPRDKENVDSWYLLSLVEELYRHNKEKLNERAMMQSIKRFLNKKNIFISKNVFVVNTKKEQNGLQSGEKSEKKGYGKAYNWIDLLSALNYKFNILKKNVKEDKINVAIERYKKMLSKLNNSQIVCFYPRIIGDVVAFYTIYHCKTSKTYEVLKSELENVVYEANINYETAPKEDETVRGECALSRTPMLWESFYSCIDQNEDEFKEDMTRFIYDHPKDFATKRYKTIIDGCMEKLGIKDENNLYEKNTSKLLKKIIDNSKKGDCGNFIRILNLPSYNGLKHEKNLVILRSLVILKIYQEEIDKNEKDYKEIIKEINRKIEKDKIGIEPLTYNCNYYTKNRTFDYVICTYIKESCEKQ